MSYFHVFVRFQKGIDEDYRLWCNKLEQEVQEYIVKPLNEGKTFLFAGVPLSRKDITEILFFESKEKIKNLKFTDGKKYSEIDANEISNIFKRNEVSGVKNSTTKFHINFEENQNRSNIFTTTLRV